MDETNLFTTIVSHITPGSISGDNTGVVKTSDGAA